MKHRQSFLNYFRKGHWRTNWKAGARIVWGKLEFSDDDKLAIAFVVITVIVMISATLIAQHA